MVQKFEIGQIVNTFGIKGMVKVVPFTDDIRRFDDLKKVYIENKSINKEFEIEEVKYHKNMVLVKFKTIDTVEQAENLRNSYLKIDRKDAVPLEENSYYIVDLIGIEVYDEEENLLGILEDVFNTGSNDIYVVKNEEHKQLLLPALSEVIKQIDIQNKKMVVHLIEGLV